MKKLASYSLVLFTFIIFFGCSKSTSIEGDVSRSDLKEINEIIAEKINKNLEKANNHKNATVKYTNNSKDNIEKNITITRINKKDNFYYVVGKVLGVKSKFLRDIDSSETDFGEAYKKGEEVPMVIVFKFTIKEDGYGVKKYYRGKSAPFTEKDFKNPKIREILKKGKML